MIILIHFDRSEAVAEVHDLPCERVTLRIDDQRWVQITYNALRSPDGQAIAVYDTEGDVWTFNNLPFSDIVIEAIA